jgi:hypothetical protein
MEINDRQPMAERNTFDALDVAEVPQRPREKLRVRSAGNYGYGAHHCDRTIQLNI